MNNVLHIFCNNKALTIFKNSSIEGSTIFFDENLIEGPLTKDVFSDNFWSERYSYFETKHQKMRIDYFDATIKPILQLEDLSIYSEVTLWLDYTKLSQINLMALGCFLAQHFSKNTQYFLVCSGKHKGKKELQKLTNYTSEEFSILYGYKVKITLPNLEFLKNCWDAYVTKNTLFNYGEFSNKFRYLQDSLNN
ncbi:MULTISPECIES: DUF1835 domain-containing protein [Tenacibaculum]|uniref:DUF1835 domain-containing protein n=1 Tax=Tenacibaculum TaxID=104267 RepID=UPI000898A48A|nr:DUF1835 domain-containing protein [Tenacibaculum sp. MAR_2010_89]SED99101.1 hypothetical protein SAMN04487765_1030 [Tenacibaculum sp. MAR_2010_89]